MARRRGPTSRRKASQAAGSGGAVAPRGGAGSRPAATAAAVPAIVWRNVRRRMRHASTTRRSRHLDSEGRRPFPPEARQPKEASHPERFDLREAVAERAGLRGATPRSGEEVPTCRRGHPGPARPRVCVDHGEPGRWRQTDRRTVVDGRLTEGSAVPPRWWAAPSSAGAVVVDRSGAWRFATVLWQGLRRTGAVLGGGHQLLRRAAATWHLPEPRAIPVCQQPRKLEICEV